MKKFTLLTAATAIFMTFCTMAGTPSVNANNGEQNYTKEDIVNLQNFLLARETPDLSDKDYDLNNDGRWDVFDLCLMKHEFLESSDFPEDTGKTLVAYYSATGTTERIADDIAEEMNADIFVITPAEEYTSADLSWTNPESRVVAEHNDPERHTELVTMDVPDWESYDNVFIGYPIWWQEASWVVDDFVKNNDFTGKNVIPFCTSSSSPLGESGTKLAEMAGTGNWLEGMRFRSSSSVNDVAEWVQSLDLTKHEPKNSVLVAYFTPAENDGVDAISSATVKNYQGTEMGAAQVLANMIAEQTGGELFSIKTEAEYPLEYNELADYAKNEQDNGILPELTSQISNLEKYDIVIVVFPVWWYTMPQAVYSFFDAYDFSGKTIVPATTHAGSYLSGSPSTIAELEPNANVLSNGFTVAASNVENAKEDVAEWVKEMGFETEFSNSMIF